MNWHFVLIKSLVQILQDIFEDGHHADKVLEYAFKKNKKWGKRDRQFLAETTYDMVRYWQLLSKFDGQEFVPPNYYKRWAFYESWKNGADSFKFLKGRDHDLGLTLDQALRKIKIADLTEQDLASFPKWFFDKISFQNLKALNQPAPVVLRTNTLKIDSQELIRKLTAEGLVVDFVNREALPDAIRLKVRRNVFVTHAFKEGLFEVQDSSGFINGVLDNILKSSDR